MGREPSRQAAGGEPVEPPPAGPPPAAGRPPRHARRRWRGIVVTLLGVALLWGALGATGYVAGWQSRQRHAQSSLVGRERAQRARVARTDGDKPCVVTAAEPGQLAGVLQVPALGLVAPVEEGTTDATLAVAVGHDGTSVWPGSDGTSVLLAHDVSYFVHLGQLRPGDRVVYQNACTTVDYTVTGQQVVAEGTPVPDSATPTLVLDTCYPSDALFFTSQRLLVQATESTSSFRGRAGGGAGPAAPAGDQPTYTVPAPPALMAEGLTLQQNEAPMGTMTLTGQPSPAWEQSPAPLALEAAALEAYFGGIDAAGQEEPGWWSAIAEPGVPLPAPLEGAAITGHTAPLDVAIQSTGGMATSVVLSTTVTVAGGPAPGTYRETVTTPVHGSTVLIGSWAMTPA